MGENKQETPPCHWCQRKLVLSPGGGDDDDDAKVESSTLDASRKRVEILDSTLDLDASGKKRGGTNQQASNSTGSGKEGEENIKVGDNVTVKTGGALCRSSEKVPRSGSNIMYEVSTEHSK